MAKAKNNDTDDFDIDKFSDQMIDKMNESLGEKIVHNLGKDEDPAKITQWYSTNCILLDWVCSGRKEGGLPGGRFVEISGVESIGKSHIAYQVAKWVQDQGGIINYADTELASSIENLRALGINTSKRFQYSKPKSIEETFTLAETFFKHTSAIPKNKKPPLLFVYDSIGGVGSSIESNMAFDDIQRPGLTAKTIAFGLRKVKNVVSSNDALFLIVNQLYDVMNAGMYEKKTITKGGKAIRYDSAVRIELSAHGYVYPEDMERTDALKEGINPVGIRIKASIVKNKVAAPFRTAEFEIHFGVGLKCHNQIWDLLCKEGEVDLKNGMVFRVITNSGWKNFGVFHKDSNKEVMSTGNFRKKDLEQMISIDHYKVIKDAVDIVMEEKMKKDNKNAIDPTLLETEENNSDELLDEVG